MATVLVSGGSSGIGLATVEEATDTEAHRIFEANVFGPMRLARAALPVNGTGVFVTVVAPGLFRTAMSERPPSVQVGDGPAYAKAFGRPRGHNAGLMA